MGLGSWYPSAALCRDTWSCCRHQSSLYSQFFLQGHFTFFRPSNAREGNSLLLMRHHISPWVQLCFNPDLSELIPQSQLDSEFGGEYAFEFDHESYWKQIVEHCGIADDGTRLPGCFDRPRTASIPVDTEYVLLYSFD